MKTLILVLSFLSAPVLAAEIPADLASQIDAYLKPYVELNAFSGVVLVADGDRIVFEKGYGMANYEFGVPNTSGTRFAIASITKRFTGIIIQRLIDEKKLSAGDTLSKWVPDFPKADRITVEHLLLHRSGLRDPDKLRRTIRASRTTREVVDLLKVEPLGSEPGAEYSYTTANYSLLAHIIERVTGRPWSDVVRTYIYEPAGMKDSGELVTTSVVPKLATGYMPDPYGKGLAVCGPEDTSWKAAGGSSYSTARDLVRFTRALYAGKLLPGFESNVHFRTSDVLGKKAHSSSGSFPGASANLLSFRDEGVTVVVLSNNYATVPGAITRDVAGMVFGQKAPSPAVKLASSPAPIDPRLLGTYAVEGRPWTLTISLHEGRPLLSWNEIRQSALLRVDGDTWFSPLDWARFQLRFDESGTFQGTMSMAAMEPLRLIRK
jgi:CubicO group peptidase (beta-lactamase class C family)